MKKQAQINRESAARLLSALARVRGECSDMAAKRRLRSAEEKLALAPPTEREEAVYIDGELTKLLGELPGVLAGGVLTERYLDRIEMLLSRRCTLA